VCSSDLSPKACFNIWCVSAAVLPSLKQNFIQTGQPLQNHKITETQQWKYVHQQYTKPLNSTPLATLIQEGCVGRYLLVFHVLITIRAQN
jgi:hypothetical protein